MYVVDTNVLVYAANADAPEHGRCRQLVEGWRRGVEPWYTTWAILYEFMRVVTHPRVLPKPLAGRDAMRFVGALLGSPGHRVLIASERHAAFLQQTLDEVPAVGGNVMHDLHTAVLMREHGIRRIYTRDTDFYRFPFLEVIDPLR